MECILSIIIVNYNTKKMTAECIRSIIENIKIKKRAYEIIVVDNNSKDNSIEYFEKEFSKEENIKIIGNKENYGFGYANNIGANYSKGKLILFLNSDTVYENVNIKKLIGFMEKKNEIGFLSIKLLNDDKSIQSIGYNYPSIINDFKLCFLFWNFNFVKKLRLKNYTNRGLVKVDWVSGAFMLCRKSDFEKIGRFDEKIFMYAEDIDISKRMEFINKKNYVYDKESIIHLHGYSSKNKKLKLKESLTKKQPYYYIIEKNKISKNINTIKCLNTIHICILVIGKKVLRGFNK